MARYYRIANFSHEDLIEVSCAVCGGRRARILGNDNGFIVRKCVEPSCGFVYISPRPSKEQLLTMYLDYYPESDVVPDKWQKEMKGIFDQVAHWLTSRQKKGHLLDVGCSFGHMLMEMERRGWQTVGVEPSQVAANYAKERIRGTVLDVPFEDVKLDRESFDALISLYVLEHVSDPRAFLSKCFDLLRPGGQAIIRIPRTEPLMPFQRLFGRPLMYAPMHLNDFSPHTMQRLCRDIGFRDIKVCVGHVRHSQDFVEYMGALVLGTVGQALEAISRGAILFPWTGSLSYRLIK